MDKPELKELGLAALREDLRRYGLRAGDVGTVVFVHGDGLAYAVEFMTAAGRTIAVETLEAAHVKPSAGDQILHMRKLAAS
jgi:hypothetical protein